MIREGFTFDGREIQGIMEAKGFEELQCQDRVWQVDFARKWVSYHRGIPLDCISEGLLPHGAPAEVICLVATLYTSFEIAAAVPGLAVPSDPEQPPDAYYTTRT